MTSFFERTLGKFIPKRAEELKAEVHLCAFGKHPGWDDHIEDLGLDSPRLAAVKRVLYVQGIGGNIDSGAWDTAEGDDRLEGFHHLFVWHVGGDVLLGRLWSSRDGKGRTRYPMVVCAQCTDIPLRWALEEVLPRLETIEACCVASTAANDVRAAIADHRQALRRLALAVEPVPEPVVASPRALARLADRPEMGPAHQGIHRVLYQIVREMSAYQARAAGPASAGRAALRPHHMRVPQCAEPPAEAIHQWLSFLLGLLGPAIPILLIVPLGEPWLDIVVGEPGVQQFYCFRASRKAIPLATEIPYNLDEDFVARGEQWIQASQAGELLPLEAPPKRAKPEPETRAPEPEPAHYRPPRVRRRRLKWLLIILVLLALAAAGLLAVPRLLSLQPPGTGPTVAEGSWQPSHAQAWRDLCDAHYNWFAAFSESLTAVPPERWASDPTLSKLLDDLKAAEDKGLLDPRDIAGERRGYEEMGQKPPPSAREPDAIRKTEAALQFVRSVVSTLSPERWPALGRLAQCAAWWRQRGWARPAAHLDSLVAAFKPAGSGGLSTEDAVRDIGRVLQTHGDLLPQVEGLWGKIQEHQRVLGATGDKVLQAFDTYVAAETCSEPGEGSEKDIQRLVGKLTEVETKARGLATFVEGDWKTAVDRELFGAETAWASFEGTVTDDVLRLWRKEVEEYQKLPPDLDPRRKDWDGALAAIQDDLVKLARIDGKAQAAAEAFRDRLQKNLEPDIQALLARPAVRKTKSGLEQAAAETWTKVARLKREVTSSLASHIARKGDPVDWHRAVLSLEFQTSRVINQEWQTRRGQLLAGVDPAKLRERAADYLALREKMDALETGLARLEDDPKLPRELPDPAKALAGRPWHGAFAAQLGHRREEALKAGIALLQWEGGVPRIRHEPHFQRQWGEQTAAYDKWRQEAATCMAGLAALEDSLEACYLLDETPRGAPKTVAGLFDDLRRNPLLQAPPLADALKPVAERIAALRPIAALPRDALVQRARAVRGGDHPEAARALWLRLGALDDWPADDDELDTELRLRTLVADAAARLRTKDDARAKGLDDELAREGPRRWERCFRRLTDHAAADARADDEVARAARLAKAFGVDPARLPPDTQLRFRVHELRTRAGALPDNAPGDAVAREIDAFAKAVAALPEGVASRPPVAALLAELRAIAEAEGPADPGVGLAKAGPASSPAGVPWKATVGEGGAWVTYSWPEKGHVLKFMPVEPKGPGARPACISTTEVPIGLFIDVLGAADRWVEASSLLPLYDPGFCPLKGPRTWEWKRRGQELEVARHWLAREAPGGRHYPQELSPGRPTPHHPVQYVSVGAALFFARLMGCRLPTAAEWRAAFTTHGRDATANLRDATWGRQQDYVQGKHEQRLPADWPDAEVFWPDGVAPTEGKAASLVTPGDDGLLWFDAVGEPDRFQHLVGNVAEFVFDEPAAFAQQLGELRNVKAFLRFPKDHADAIRVVGASALSAPQVWDGKDKPFAQPWPVKLTEALDGYSDVGFRLAFSAPQESPAQRLKRLLAAKGYLAHESR